MNKVELVVQTTWKGDNRVCCSKLSMLMMNNGRNQSTVTHVTVPQVSRHCRHAQPVLAYNYRMTCSHEMSLNSHFGTLDILYF